MNSLRPGVVVVFVFVFVVVVVFGFVCFLSSTKLKLCSKTMHIATGRIGHDLQIINGC